MTLTNTTAANKNNKKLTTTTNANTAKITKPTTTIKPQLKSKKPKSTIKYIYTTKTHVLPKTMHSKLAECTQKLENS